MKKYRVWVKSVDYLYIDVEAEDEFDAMAEANKIGGENFTDSGETDWLVYKAVEQD